MNCPNCSHEVRVSEDNGAECYDTAGKLAACYCICSKYLGEHIE